jgi:hypothetical protein
MSRGGQMNFERMLASLSEMSNSMFQPRRLGVCASATCTIGCRLDVMAHAQAGGSLACDGSGFVTTLTSTLT